MALHIDQRVAFSVGLLSILLLVTAYLVATLPPLLSLKVFGGVLILIVAFLSTEIALHILIFSMLLSPEIVIATTPVREVTLRLEDLLLPLIGIGWLGRVAIYKDLGLVLKTPLNRPIIYYIVASFLSTLLGMAFGRVGLASGSLFVLKYIEFFVVYFMVVNHVNREDQIRRFTTAMLFVAAVISVYAILQIPTGERVSAPFEGKEGEPNTLGGYLVLMMALTIGLLLSLEGVRAKVLLGGLLFLFIWPFLFTLSRSSWLAFGGMYAFYLLKGRRRLVFILLFLMALPLLPVILPQEVQERYAETITQRPEAPSQQVRIGEYYFDLSTSERLKTWRKVVEDWRKHPILGYGVTGYGFVDGQYFRTLIESGIVGLGALLYLLGSVVVWLYRGLSSARAPFHRGLIMGTLAGTIALLAHAIGSNTFIIVRIMEPLWFLLGMAMVVPSIERREGQYG